MRRLLLGAICAVLSAGPAMANQCWPTEIWAPVLHELGMVQTMAHPTNYGTTMTVFADETTGEWLVAIIQGDSVFCGILTGSNYGKPIPLPGTPGRKLQLQ